MRSKALLAALVSLPLLAVGVTGQRGRSLFSEENATRSRTQKGQGFAASLDSDVVRQRTTQIHWDRFATSEGGVTTVARTLELNLFDDVFLVATLDRVEELSKSLIWSGRVTAPGRSEVLFVLRDGALSGRVVAAAGTFELLPTADGTYVIEQLQSGASEPPPPLPGFVLPPRVRADRTGKVSSQVVPPLDWLTAVNTRRAEAGLPAVIEKATYSAGDVLHARYCVKNNILLHAEDPANPWYTKDGDTAGKSSNVAGHSNIATPDQFAVDAWLTGPFHAVGVLDPKLKEVGFGSYREAAPGIQMAAALDVIRGRRTTTTAKFPIAWPGNGKNIAAPTPESCPPGTACFWGENPNPLTSCPGYLAPAGLPIYLQIGAGTVIPKVTSHTLSSGGVALEHCVFDETSYKNPDPASQTLGRNILNSRSAIVLIPRQPLPIGQKYDVQIVTNGATRKWSFTIQPSAPLPVTQE